VSPVAVGVIAILVGVCCSVVGLTLGFSLRDHLERRICGWFPGCDDE
jgi:hypothetical protein